MILSDNETKVDLLNNKAIAKTIVSLIKDSKEQPISIGIHGDWGAGKSSILEMVEDELSEESGELKKKYCCIRFNGWKHQGFEDSKIALMSTIVSELEKRVTINAEIKEILKKIWKNINWMSVAKTTGKTALSIATGTTPIALLSLVMNGLKTTVTTKEGIDDTIQSIGNYLKDAKITEDTSSNKEFKEFQKNFDDLLKATSIEKLVVLIDDLDRCLPNVAIDTLEAIRLFMFTKQTAFVIAADEGMIRYAVKKHFPDAIDGNNFNIGEAFANKYLEKLIQVPFRIPALGEVEACIYIMLLMVGSTLEEQNENYNKLREEALRRIQKPWDVEIFTIPDVKEILGDDYANVKEKVLIATQICHLLAQNTDGNPRKIKRFINMLLLRYEIAQNRGFKDDIQLSILGKMMLAEYYHPDFYKNLSSHLNSEGKWQEVSNILDTLDKEINEDDKENRWYDFKNIKKWLISEPKIIDIDLRPYYYACKEKIDYFSGKIFESDSLEIINLLFEDRMAIVGKVDSIKSLNSRECEKVFSAVQQKIIETGKFNEKPKGIDGLIILTENKPELREKLVGFIDSIPPQKAGLWILKGWNKAIPKGCIERNGLDKYFERLKEDGNSIVKEALSRIQEE